MMRTVARFSALLVLCGWAATSAAGPEDLRARLLSLESQMLSLGDRAIPVEKWDRLNADLAAVATQAADQGDWTLSAQARLAQARAWGDLRQDVPRAIELLHSARTACGKAQPDTLRSLMVAEAEMLARKGDAASIQRLIVDFKNSPLFDPKSFEYQVGNERNPVIMTRRLNASGEESLALLSLQKYLEQARASSGAAFPLFSFNDVDGNPITSTDVAGHVVLFDFWADGSVSWERNLPFAQRAYAQYRKEGFTVIGISLNLDAAGIEAARRRLPGLAWPLIDAAQGRKLASKVGLFGESGTFLVDRRGRIRARNLQGQALTDAVKQLVADPAR